MLTTATPESAGQEKQTIGHEDVLRAATYALLGNLLSAPPDTAMLDRLRSAETEDSGQDPLAAAWAALALSADPSQVGAIDDEFHQLFIGLGRGELVPYASWYMTGFLMERPLGELRRDLLELGIERNESVREPEDHAAALCQIMALLIGDPAYSRAQEHAFYERHIEPWVSRFFTDLESAKGAVFYQMVGRLGRQFMVLEKQSQGMSV